MVGFGIATIEKIADKDSYKKNGIFSWKVFRTIDRNYFEGKKARILNLFMKYPNIIFLQSMVLLCCVMLLILSFSSPLRLLFLTILLVGLLINNIRLAYGNDGSDQLLGILIICLVLQSLFSQIQKAQIAILIFIAAQSCLAYLTSGWVKIIGAKWTGGSAVYEIFNTRTYGAKQVASYLQSKPNLGKLLCWGVISFELLFPLVVLLPQPFMLLFIGGGVLFHLLNALIMGLNTFLPAFAATYPALIFCNHLIYTNNWAY